MTFRFYIVTEDCSVCGTDSFDVAVAAKRDGVSIVIEPAKDEATFDGESEIIQVADPEDYLDDPLDLDKEDDE
jgi:hypothetical protein